MRLPGVNLVNKYVLERFETFGYLSGRGARGQMGALTIIHVLLVFHTFAAFSIQGANGQIK